MYIYICVNFKYIIHRVRGGQGRGGGGGWGLTIRCQVCIPCLQVLLLVYVFAFCYCFGMGSNELIHSDAFTFSALNCSSKTPALTHWTLINRNIFIWGVDWFWGGWVGGGGCIYPGGKDNTCGFNIGTVFLFCFCFWVWSLRHCMQPCSHSFSSDGVYSLRP